MNKSTEKLLKNIASMGYAHVLRREIIEFRAARQLVLANICYEDYELSTGSYLVIKFGKVKP